MCNANKFRTLYPDEIEVRVQSVKAYDNKARAVLLLYKNARVDMDLLDEEFGCLGWQREHTFKNGKNYCKVSVYDTAKQMWVSKEDVGVESNTEETKGEASDAFKRACVNLGIGRELYSAPQITIDLAANEWKRNEKSNKEQINSWIKFRVSAITYNAERKIIGLSIADANGKIRYTLGVSQPSESQIKPAQSTKRPLTLDKIMNETFLLRVCEWINRNSNGQKCEDVIAQNYDCDDEVKDCITKEYNRLYA